MAKTTAENKANMGFVFIDQWTSVPLLMGALSTLEDFRILTSAPRISEYVNKPSKARRDSSLSRSFTVGVAYSQFEHSDPVLYFSKGVRGDTFRRAVDFAMAGGVKELVVAEVGVSSDRNKIGSIRFKDMKYPSSDPAYKTVAREIIDAISEPLFDNRGIVISVGGNDQYRTLGFYRPENQTFEPSMSGPIENWSLRADAPAAPSSATTV
jgi:hypothetical protein